MLLKSTKHGNRHLGIGFCFSNTITLYYNLMSVHIESKENVLYLSFFYGCEVLFTFLIIYL